MRAAVVALVLIIGAIAILWLGNTLNSWVLGGLIGGFAALLISIPISVTLFLYLSRHHEEKIKAEAEQNLSFEPSDPYMEERQIEFYDADADVLDTEEDWYEEEFKRAPNTGRNLSAPSYGHVPAVRQRQALTSSSTGMTGARQRSSDLTPARRAFPQPSVQRQYGASFPKQAQKSTRSQHHTAALHVARLEAMQQQADTDTYSQYSPTTSKRLPVVRPDQRMVEQPSIPPSARPAQQSSRQFQRPFPNQNPHQYRPRKVVDGTSMPAINNPRSLPPEGGSSASRQTQQQHYAHFNEPETGKIGGSEPQTGQLQGDKYSPQTGPMRQQPRTGQIVRNPQVEEQRGNPERVSGSLQNPMVRRAPYMYEDDPLRQEFAQHLDAPVVRRSSRKLHYEEAED